jgi:predicted ATPase/DNA-binding XRE family transcriptional regulator
MDRAEERGANASAFGTLLRRHRIAARLSQEELAERARMSVDAIGALERGVRRWPQRATVDLLADALRLENEQRQEFAAAAARPRLPREDPTGRVPTVSGSDDGPAAGNLPLAVKSLVGRGAETGEIARLLAQARMVTITGAGGIGKTSIALDVGRRLRDGIDGGAWVIELGALRDSALVVATIARTLAIAGSANRPLLDDVVAYLKGKRILLILDNCEHVIGEAAMFASAVLSSCPGVKILATSREPLRIAGEHAYALPPLAMPEADFNVDRLAAVDAAKFAAIGLFAERARAVDARFSLSDENAPTVVKICRRLDGIPLAIELAAARITVLPIDVLHQKLDNRFEILRSGERTAKPRHQTMRALIDWSYDLLSEAERTLFRRLSVFSGGWTIEAACDVCSDEDTDGWEVFDLLASLVTKSLVVVDGSNGEMRYGLLESTMDYARERLAASAEQNALAQKHACYYTQRLRELRGMWEAMDDLAWQHAVLTEVENLRAALDWTLRNGKDNQRGVEILSLILVPALIFDHGEARFWYTLGYQRLHSVTDESIATAFRSRYAATSARLYVPIAVQVSMCEANVVAARSLGDPALLADTLRELGVAFWRARRLDEADKVYAEAWAVLAPVNPALASRIIFDWGNNDYDRGNLESARARFQKALQIARPGSQMHAIALMSLAEAEYSAGSLEDARILGYKAMAALRILGMKTEYAAVACNLASYELERNSYAEASALLQEALELFRELDLGYWLTVAVEKYAVFAALTGENEVAAALLGYVDRHNELLGRERQANEQRSYDHAVGLLRTRLGDEFEQRRSKGSKFDEEQALEFVTSLGGGGARSCNSKIGTADNAHLKREEGS